MAPGLNAIHKGESAHLAAIYPDGEKSWAHIRHVPGVGGYLSVAQAPNGVIFLFGTRMSCVAFNESWLRAGQPLPEP